MSGPGQPQGDDVEALRPVVAASRPQRGGVLLMASAGALGLAAFLWLSHQRTPAPAGHAAKPGAVQIAALDPPPGLDLAEAAARGIATTSPAAPPAPPIAFGTPVAQPSLALGKQATSPTAAELAGEADQQQRLRSPALIVDLAPPGEGGSAGAAAAGAPQGSAKSETGKAADKAARLSGDEQFAARIGGAEPDQAHATLLGDTAHVVPQGAIIPAVLETALNSDLPGFARAVVSRDVRGFDGSTVLIPRGSRLIGQYKSGVAQGQSRAFVIWTRLIRPDGASIQIGSPAADTLGRTGLQGAVDRHFIERFSNSVLLSVVDAGVASLFRGPNTQILVGSSQEAAGLAATIATPAAIAPTIKVPQGAPVRVFVAKDLDFSTASGAKP
ncbi:TrbI/VirB10 family protein [Phenylobacterium montanum]|uniref:TrbI/VirB10 family protein n=1 Tax=Phenylobacterium montanum TaxID=2823693 RepID=A0A975G2R3_9CAUL|nr:TrbI/VirB10 family protein [Caulobacter sp. S6]QUD89815.1 TrbI/VirB10 family protein [Caulobacter sp. S6]